MKEKTLLQQLDALLKAMEKQGLHNIIDEIESKHFKLTVKEGR